MSAKKKKKTPTRTQTRAERERAARGGRVQGAHVPVATAEVSTVDRSAERFFVDVSIVRIQSYLARTSDLRGFRGASVRISAETSNDLWRAHLAELGTGVQINPDAGNIDGVISLETSASTDRHSAAEHVVSVLRERLPAAYITAVAGSGATYPEAYIAMKRNRESGDLLIDAPPPAPELVMTKPCDRCRSWPAVAQIANHSYNATVDKNDEGCSDCLTRYPDIRNTDTRTSRAEALLLEHIPAGRRVAGKFNDLAEGDHLALLYCDGNRVGAFIDRANRAGADTTGIAADIDRATAMSLATAIASNTVMLPGKTVPAIPHILGGDDVQVSVRAADAWAIAQTMLADFGGHMTEAARSRKPRRRGGPPLPVMSMSAALVFFHRATPLIDVLEYAARELKRAKHAVRGEVSSIAFLDISMDGATPPPSRPVFATADLARWNHHLSEVASLAASHRSTLLQLCRDGRVDEARRRVERHNSSVCRTLESAGLDLRNQLELARWWRPAT